MRDPTRETVRAHELQAALDLLSAMETGSRLIGLVAVQVRLEFAGHADGIANEAEDALKKLTSRLARIDAIAATFGAVGAANLGHLDGHVFRSRAIVDRWMKVAISAPQAADVPSRAIARVNLAKTPARKGSSEVKDCVIIETYLDVISSLRSAGLSSKVTFVSSNTNDYAAANHGSLKPDLEADFTKIGMDYAPNLAATKHLLGL
jgi:hypothetical protein